MDSADVRSKIILKKEKMKNFIYAIILIASSSIYAQTSIENDALFLKYEQEYLKFGKSNLSEDYEQANKDFNSKFTNYKDLIKFRNNNDKERWLTKNYKKTQFTTAQEAVSSYNNIVISSYKLKKSSSDLQEIRTELLKRYDENLIWQTLQARIKAK